MSKHNRERREIRRKWRAGQEITLEEGVKTRKHVARKLRSGIPDFLRAYANGVRPKILTEWQSQALLDAGIKI